MQYYKLLAKEVEKRISILQPYLDNDSNSENNTDTLEISDSVQEYDEDDIGQNTSHNISKITEVEIQNDTITNNTITSNTLHSELFKYASNDPVADTTVVPAHLILDFTLNINETCNNMNDNSNLPPKVMDIPERDYNCVKSVDFVTDMEMKNIRCKQQQDTTIEEIVNFSYSIARDKSTDNYLHDSLSEDGRSLLSSKSFTGSLNNIQMQSESNNLMKPLVRQHSYTILNPSPQLLAHLEVQSLNLGVDMSCISMSESLSNLNSPGKRRRNWDLESAKAKWSNMAMELKQKNLSKPKPRRSTTRGTVQRAVSPSRAKCVAAARTKYSTLSLKQTMKSDVVPRSRPQSPARTRTSSPARVRTSSPVNTPSSSTITLEQPVPLKNSKESKSKNPMESTSPKTNGKKGPQESPKTAKESAKTNQKNQPHKSVTPQQQRHSEQNHSPKGTPQQQQQTVNMSAIQKHLSISDSNDPAARVRELYEKIQQQQKIQMVSLMEKQKREQMLLQKAFEEQNSLLFKQLKTICPKSPEKAMEAWGKTDMTDRGPVSLSQLINSKSPEHPSRPVSSTLTDSNEYLNHCDVVLKKSRDITDNLKTIGNSSNHKGTRISGRVHLEGSRTRTSSPTSPTQKSTPTSRRLNYDTSGSERDYDMMLTDRTNDTLAGLNVTFPSDSEETHCSHRKGPEVTVLHKNTPIRSTDSAIKCMEQTIYRSMNSCNTRVRNVVNCQPTARQVKYILTDLKNSYLDILYHSYL